MAKNTLQQWVQGEAYSLVFMQLAGVMLLAWLVLLVSGGKNAFSVFAGGLAYGLPNLIFVWRVFRFVGAHQMTQFMAAFFVGEMLKLFASGIMFLLVVKYLPVSLSSVLAGFIAGIASFWVASIWYFTRNKKVR